MENVILDAHRYVVSSYTYNENPTKIFPQKEVKDKCETCKALKKKSEKEIEAYKKFIAAQVKLIEASKVYTNAYEEVQRLEKEWDNAYKEDN